PVGKIGPVPIASTTPDRDNKPQTPALVPIEPFQSGLAQYRDRLRELARRTGITSAGGSHRQHWIHRWSSATVLALTCSTLPNSTALSVAAHRAFGPSRPMSSRCVFFRPLIDDSASRTCGPILPPPLSLDKRVGLHYIAFSNNSA